MMCVCFDAGAFAAAADTILLSVSV